MVQIGSESNFQDPLLGGARCGFTPQGSPSGRGEGWVSSLRIPSWKGQGVGFFLKDPLLGGARGGFLP